MATLEDKACEMDITQEAQQVQTKRQSAYGHPYDDFSRTAAMMTGIGFRMREPSTGQLREIKAKDIPIFMILVKLSREVNQHKPDNLVDIIGYTKTLDTVVSHSLE